MWQVSQENIGAITIRAGHAHVSRFVRSQVIDNRHYEYTPVLVIMPCARRYVMISDSSGGTANQPLVVKRRVDAATRKTPVSVAALMTNT